MAAETKNVKAPNTLTMDEAALRAKLPPEMRDISVDELVRLVKKGVTNDSYTKLYDKANRDANTRIRHLNREASLKIINEERVKVGMKPMSELK